MNIEKLVNEFPNDAELGGKVRQQCIEGKENIQEFLKKYKDAKIFESPDGGKTVYVRGFGEPLLTRKLSTNQLNLFDEIN
jgi:hypothetical protein